MKMCISQGSSSQDILRNQMKQFYPRKKVCHPSSFKLLSDQQQVGQGIEGSRNGQREIVQFRRHSSFVVFPWWRSANFRLFFVVIPPRAFEQEQNNIVLTI